LLSSDAEEARGRPLAFARFVHRRHLGCVEPKSFVSEAPPDAPLSSLYRGQLDRAGQCQARVDATTHWALSTSALMVAWALARPAAPAGLVLVAFGAALWFLLLEARRYRYYDAAIRRVRLMEGGYWAPALRQEPADPDALKELAGELSRPYLRLSLLRALALRVRATYGLLFAALLCAWYAKLNMHPAPAKSLGEQISRARMAAVPGHMVFAGVAALGCLLLFFYVASWLTHAPTEELRPRPSTPMWAPWRASLRRWAAKARRSLQSPD
jgi:uncharacterized membrane protein